MIRKSLFLTLIILSFSLLSFAQTGAVRGLVELQNADGTKTPYAGAVVEAFRADIKGKLPTAKTDKKGVFNFVGVALGATYTIAVSGADIDPAIYPNVKAGREDIAIIVVKGSGKRLTEDEVKERVGAGGTPGTPVDSAKAKKEQEEFEKKKAEVEANNAKVKETNKLINDTLNAGNAAYAAKNYDLAISEFNRGIEADPTHPGAPVLLTNKAIALRVRGVNRFNAAIKGEGSLEDAKKDFLDAAEAVSKAVELIKSSTPPTDPEVLKNFNQNKFNAFSGRAESLRLAATKADQTKVGEMYDAYKEYLEIETVAENKTKAKINLAQALLDAGDVEKAAVEFEGILADAPDNIDALAGAGLVLVNLGYINNDKAKFQSGANYLAKYVELAPEGHKFKTDARNLLDTLKKEQNIKAEKPTKPTSTPKKKP
ncbi:MAG: hypothetical protein MUC29_11255 [Pyrinomonadaceae bacterium]|jgi:tetratricopeptide (TPR) repeat protein|nr:hypothetical protein [Pyrinomonadaceae bacterium]